MEASGAPCRRRKRIWPSCGCGAPHNETEGTRTQENPMLLVREIMYCKPGKVRPLVEKFLAMAKLSAKVGMPKMRVMTDVCSDRYWMLVAEMEVANMAEFERMMQGGGPTGEDRKEFESIMKGYHDLVDHGRREIYKIEA